MTGPKIFAPEYYERMRDLEQNSWWNAAMRDVAGGLIARKPLAAAGLLLDVGCGSGQTMEWFEESWPGWRAIGLDVARDGLQAARHAFSQTVLGGSAMDLPLPDRCVDAVITLDVLQHLPLDGGDVRALHEIRRVLRPGGVLFIRTNAQSWPSIADDPRYNFHKYTPRELREKLQGAGFLVRRLSRINAVLGLAEIPRELRARKSNGPGYVGLLADAAPRGISWNLKNAWLRFEGSIIRAGAELPLGRTLIALAEVPGEPG